MQLLIDNRYDTFAKLLGTYKKKRMCFEKEKNWF